MSDSGEKTYGITLYVEVKARTVVHAREKLRSYLAPPYRDTWEPIEIEEVDA